MFLLHELSIFIDGRLVGLVPLVGDMGFSHPGDQHGIRASLGPDLNFLLQGIKKPQWQKYLGLGKSRKTSTGNQPAQRTWQLPRAQRGVHGGQQPMDTLHIWVPV